MTSPSFLAPRVHTSLGALPGPAVVFDLARGLANEHFDERAKQAGSDDGEEQCRNPPLSSGSCFWNSILL